MVGGCKVPLVPRLSKQTDRQTGLAAPERCRIPYNKIKVGFKIIQILKAIVFSLILFSLLI